MDNHKSSSKTDNKTSKSGIHSATKRLQKINTYLEKKEQSKNSQGWISKAHESIEDFLSALDNKINEESEKEIAKIFSKEFAKQKNKSDTHKTLQESLAQIKKLALEIQRRAKITTENGEHYLQNLEKILCKTLKDSITNSATLVNLQKIANLETIQGDIKANHLLVQELTNAIEHYYNKYSEVAKDGASEPKIASIACVPTFFSKIFSTLPKFCKE